LVGFPNTSLADIFGDEPRLSAGITDHTDAGSQFIGVLFKGITSVFIGLFPLG
jgi:hypothetical protein